MAVLLALAAAVGWGSSDFAAGVASRRSTAVSVVILTHFSAVVALLLVSFDLGAMFAGGVGQGGGLGPIGFSLYLNPGALRMLGAPSAFDLGWGVVAGISGGFGAMLLYRGLGKGAMAVVAPITAAGAAASPAVFGLLTGESLSPLGIGGLLLAMVAIVLVSAAGGDEPMATVASSVGPADDPVVAGMVPLPQRLVRTGQRRLRRPSPNLLPHTILPFLALCFVAAPLSGSARTASLPVLESSWFNGEALGLIGLGVLLFVVSARAVAAWTPATATVVRAPQPWAVHEVTATAPTEATAPAEHLPVRRGFGAPGVFDAMLSGLGFGGFFILLNRTAETAGNWPLVAARGASVVMFTAAAVFTRGQVLPAKGTRRAVVAAGLLDAAAAVLFVAATRTGLLSISAVLSSMYPGITVLLARMVTKERCTRVQLIGLGVAATAVGLLAVS